MQTIGENARYVVGKAQSLDFDSELRDKVARPFQSLLSALVFSVRGELHAMSDKLNPDSSREYSNRDPAVNGDLIVRWVGSDLEAVEALIEEVRDGGQGTTHPALEVLLLVSEANIRKAYAEMRQAVMEMKAGDFGSNQT